MTYFLGISDVLIEVNGVNQSMTAYSDTYTYTWTPTTAGNYTFTIYMESNIETWSSVSGLAEILDVPSGGRPIDTTTLLIIAGAIAVVVIIIVIIAKGRGKK